MPLTLKERIGRRLQEEEQPRDLTARIEGRLTGEPDSLTSRIRKRVIPPQPDLSAEIDLAERKTIAPMDMLGTQFLPEQPYDPTEPPMDFVSPEPEAPTPQLTATPALLEFERRMTQPNAPFIQNLDGSISTHKMAWGSDKKGFYAFPTIVNRNGQLVELSPEKADVYAHQTGELKRFSTQTEAEVYAAGSWKTPQPTTKPHRLAGIPEPTKPIPPGKIPTTQDFPFGGAIPQGKILDIKAIGEAINLMWTGTDPATDRPYQETLAKDFEPRLEFYLESAKRYIHPLAGMIFPYTPETKEELRKRAEVLKGFGPALMPAAAQSAELAADIWMYQKLFGLAAKAGEVIKLPKVLAKFEKLPGVAKYISAHPFKYKAMVRAFGAFGKSAVVGPLKVLAEPHEELKTYADWAEAMGKRAAILGIFTATLQAAWTRDQYSYLKSVDKFSRSAIVKAYNSNISKMGEGGAKLRFERDVKSLRNFLQSYQDQLLQQGTKGLIPKKPGITAQDVANRLVKSGFNDAETQKILRAIPTAPTERARWKAGERNKALKMLRSSDPKTRARGRAVLDFLESPKVQLPREPASKTVIKAPATSTHYFEAHNPETAERLIIPDVEMAKIKLPKGWVVSDPIAYSGVAAEVAEEIAPPIKAARPAPEVAEVVPEIAERKEVIEREPKEHLVSIPKAGEEIAPPKGTVKAVPNPRYTPETAEEEPVIIKYEDFGNGLGLKGNDIIHTPTLNVLMPNNKTKANARKIAAGLSQIGVDFTQDIEAVKANFREWTTENIGKWAAEHQIRGYFEGEPAEVQVPEIFEPVQFLRNLPAIKKKLKGFVNTVPEFTLNPVFTFEAESGQLVFKDRYRYGIFPKYFGLDAAKLKEGDTVRIDLAAFEIKQPSKKKLKEAEYWIGEEKILGRETVAEPVPEVPAKPAPPTEKVAPVSVKPSPEATWLKDVEPAEYPAAATQRHLIGRVRYTWAGRDYSKVAYLLKGDKVVLNPGSEQSIRDLDKFVKDVESGFYTIETKPTPSALERKPVVERLAEPAFEILNIRGQRYGGLFKTREEAQRYLDKRITAPAAKIQFTIQEIKPTEAVAPSEFIPPTKRIRPLGRIPTPEFAPSAEAPKHIRNVVVDTFREWPKEIKRVGSDYWTEVMATAKSLTTPYRYKALRQTLLGVFRFKKGTRPEVVGIELQDITDALTATHELGHNIDWLLNDESYPSSIKERFPAALQDKAIKERQLRAELHKVSKILRPDIWKIPKPDVKRHTELMADFISHYILDPEATKSLAPTMTRLFEARIADNPRIFDTISRLQESRYAEEIIPVAEHIRETFPLPKEFTPLQLNIDMQAESYVKAAEALGITAARHYKVLMHRADTQADRIDKLVPDKNRQTDLVVIAEKGTKNPWTDKTYQQILAETPLRPGELQAITLFRANQELARQTVNKYLRGADVAEYIKFIEDYFVHAYETPLTLKYKTAISKWAKRSPQAKKRILPDLAKAVEIGLKPRAKTLSEGLKLWAGINYRVATNKAFLRILPKITNDDGVSILQKPQDFPHWPTVDYFPIRQTYAIPLKDRGILLFQGRVAVDPRVKPFIDAMFGRRVFNTPVRTIEGLNALWKGFQLTLFSLFHHQAEFFSACGSLGPRALPFVGGYWGKRATAFGQKKVFGFLPAHIGILKAGKELEKCNEFMDDYLAHGGQRGYITTEGRNLLERMLKNAAGYLEDMVQIKPTTPLTGVFAAAYVPTKTASAIYTLHQHILWDNVQRAKLVTYYRVVADGAKNSNLPIKEVKELACEYLADNYGGQEWLNTIFRKPKTRQFWTQLMMSLDWTWSQIKTARWPLGIGGGKSAARRAFMRRIGRHHWFWYISAIAGFTIAAGYAMSDKGPWENEIGHKLDIDWTNLWRNLPWNRDWKERGDYNRRYIGLGKAGRELVRWATDGLMAFGFKLSPVARTIFEQGTGYNIGSSWAEPWAKEDLELYEETYERFKHLLENFRPFAFSGNNAFLAFPSKKGMTRWKAIRAYEEIYEAKAKLTMGGLGATLTKVSHILDRNKEKLMREIVEACEANKVDSEKAQRAALAFVRSKYYRLFWNSSKLPEKQAIKMCNRYAEVLIELGVVPKGFKQSLRYRVEELPEKARDRGIRAFQKAAEQPRKQ